MDHKRWKGEGGGQSPATGAVGKEKETEDGGKEGEKEIERDGR